MARLRYYPTPADFAIGFGESVPLLDADGVTPISGNPTGRLAAVPEASVSFQVCTTEDIADVTTDLLDGDGTPITVWSTSTDFVTLGRGPILQGPDNHVGPLYLTSDAGVTFYRIEPDSTEVYARLAAAEAALAAFPTTALSDWSETAPTDGQIPIFDTGNGEWAPGSPAGTGTVTSVAGEEPVAGDVPVAELLAALGLTNAASDLAAIVAGVKTVLKAGAGGYGSKGIFTYGEYQGTPTPSTGVVDGDTWLQPVSEGSFP